MLKHPYIIFLITISFLSIFLIESISNITFTIMVLPLFLYIVSIFLGIILSFFFLYYIQKPLHHLYRINYKYINKEINRNILYEKNDLDEILKSIKNATKKHI